jgi:hypothetical protein
MTSYSEVAWDAQWSCMAPCVLDGAWEGSTSWAWSPHSLMGFDSTPSDTARNTLEKVRGSARFGASELEKMLDDSCLGLAPSSLLWLGGN